jgi:hypothetical protein
MIKVDLLQIEEGIEMNTWHTYDISNYAIVF